MTFGAGLFELSLRLVSAVTLEISPDEASQLLALGKPTVGIGGPLEASRTSASTKSPEDLSVIGIDDHPLTTIAHRPADGYLATFRSGWSTQPRVQSDHADEVRCTASIFQPSASFTNSTS